MARWEPSKINLRQELFLREFIKTSNATEAWQKVYKNTSRKGAKTNAYKALLKPHVQKHCRRLQERIMKKQDITVEKILKDYEDALELAREQRNSPAMVNAAQAQAKLVGLLRDRVETGNVGDFGDTTSIEGILEIVSKEAGPEAAMTLATMFGLKLPDNPNSKAIQEAALFITDPASDSVN